MIHMTVLEVEQDVCMDTGQRLTNLNLKNIDDIKNLLKQ